jgi:hypothetical protein
VWKLLERTMPKLIGPDEKLPFVEGRGNVEEKKGKMTWRVEEAESLIGPLGEGRHRTLSAGRPSRPSAPAPPAQLPGIYHPLHMEPAGLSRKSQMLRQVWPSLRQYLCRRPSLSRLVVYSLITTVTLIGGLLLSPYSASFRSMLPSNLFFPPSSGPSESSGDLPRVSLWPRGHVPLAVGEEPPDTPSLIPFLPERK